MGRPALAEGRGDMIAAQFSKTSERASRLLFSDPVRYVQELLVTSTKNKSAPRDLKSVAGKSVSVRDSSSFKRTLEGLDLSPPVKITPLDEHLDAHTVLSKVAAGQIGLTVADSDVFDSFRAPCEPGVSRLTQAQLSHNFFSTNAPMHVCAHICNI